MGHRVMRYNPTSPLGRIFDSDEVPKGEGWVDDPRKVGPLPASSVDDPVARIAALERQLEEARAENALLRREIGGVLSEKPEADEIAEIVEMISVLDPKVDYTIDGKPRVDALAALIGRDITSEDRDRAFEEYQKLN